MLKISPEEIIFQLLMVFAAVYYAMLLTNWGQPEILDEYQEYLAESNASYWVNLSAMWVSMAIYIFSLLGPLLSNRDFGN